MKFYTHLNPQPKASRRILPMLMAAMLFLTSMPAVFAAESKGSFAHLTGVELTVTPPGGEPAHATTEAAVAVTLDNSDTTTGPAVSVRLSFDIPADAPVEPGEYAVELPGQLKSIQNASVLDADEKELGQLRADGDGVVLNFGHKTSGRGSVTFAARLDISGFTSGENTISFDVNGETWDFVLDTALTGEAPKAPGEAGKATERPFFPVGTTPGLATATKIAVSWGTVDGNGNFVEHDTNDSSAKYDPALPGSRIFFDYAFTIAGGTAVGLGPNIVYTFELPKAMVLKNVLDFDLKTDAGVSYGTVTLPKVSESGNEKYYGKITFNANITTAVQNSDVEGTFHFMEGLDQTIVENSETHTFKYPGIKGEQTITIPIKQQTEDSPCTVVKTGTNKYYEAAKATLIEWQVKFTPKTTPFPRELINVIFTDTIPAGQTFYDEIGFKPTLTASAGSTAILPVDSDHVLTGTYYNADTKTLSFKIGSIPKADVNKSAYTLKFYTKPALNNAPQGTAITFKNTAEFDWTDTATNPVESPKLTVSDEGETKITPTYIEKAGELIPNYNDSGTKAILWTITLNKSQLSLANIVITDVIPTGLTFAENFGDLAISYSTDKTTWTNLQADEYELTSDTSTPPANTLTITAEASGGVIPNPLETMAYIRFVTTIDNYEELHQTNGTWNFTNNAVLNATGVSGATGASKPVGVDGSVLLKIGTADYAKHQMNWDITINKNNINLGDVVLTDTIPTGGTSGGPHYILRDQITVDGKGFEWDASGNGTWKGTSTNNTITATCSDDRPLTFTISITKVEEAHSVKLQTQIPDENGELWANNQETQFKNNATLTWGVDKTIEAAAHVDYKSQVLDKTFIGGSYDYNTREITWQVVVNQNKMTMTNAVLKDTIPNGLRYVDGSMKVTAASNGNLTSGNPSVTATPAFEETSGTNTGDLVITFGEFDTQLTIQFKTEVTEWFPGFGTTNGSLTANNKINLTCGEMGEILLPGGVDDNADGTFPSQTGAKRGAPYVFPNNFIEWTVDINRNQFVLKNLTLTDELDALLTLDPSTVKVYKAAIAANGAMTKNGAALTDAELPEGWLAYTAKADGVENAKDKLVVTFPADSDIAAKGTPYILEFRTYFDYSEIANGGTNFTNSVKLDGDGKTEITTETTSTPVNVNLSSGGGDVSNWYGTLKLQKKDKQTGKFETYLAGAKFELVGADGKPLKTYNQDGSVRDNPRVVGANGMLEWSPVPLYYDYWLKETETPAGYIANTTLTHIGMPKVTNKKVVNPEPVIIENSRMLSSIEVTKKGKDTAALLDGATFELRQEGVSDTIFLETKTTVGGKVKFENLPWGYDYTLKEITAPIGYVPAPTPITITELKDAPTAALTVTRTVENTIKAGSLKVIKTDDATLGSVLQGAVFTLTDQGTGGVIATETTNANGEILFDKLLRFGVTYTLTETKAPDGYEIKTPFRKDYKIAMNTNDSQGTIVLTETVTNTRLPGEIIVTKKDSLDGKLLPGAVFELKNAAGVVLATANSDASGTVKFGNLRWGETYTVTETAPPDGYHPPAAGDKALTATLDAVKRSAELEFVNAPILGSATIEKSDKSTNLPLAGVVFELLDKDQKPLGIEKTTGADGKAEFTDLRVLMQYYIREKSAPDIYILDPTPHPVRLAVNAGAAAAATVKVENERKPQANLAILKVETGNPANKLAGAVFELLDKDKKPLTPKTTATSSKDGIASFKDIPLGDYVLREVMPPSGYNAVQTEWAIALTDADRGKTIEMTVENNKHTSGGGTVILPNEPEEPKPTPPVIKPPENIVTTPDTDKDGSITIEPGDTPLVTWPPTHGDITVDGDGHWQYTPDPGFVGRDYIEITVHKKDGTDELNIIDILVEEVPLAKALPTTGGTSELWFYLGGAGCLALGAGLLWRSRKRRR